MTDRDDVERLRAAEAEVVDLALGFLRPSVANVDWADPEQARDALVEVVPTWVQEFGDSAASVAADWYEDTRPAVLGAYTARTVPPASEEQIRESLRDLLGGVNTADAAYAAISGGVQRLVQYSGRATIARNVRLDPQRPRFARIPSGTETCAWCEMLASRGFVYYSEDTAGAIMQYHDDCDCVLASSWDAENAHIAGYDPDAMYDRYLAARGDLEAEGNLAPTDKQVAARMRELFPTKYTDASTKQIIAAGAPDLSDAVATRRYWQARQANLRAGDIGELLEQHEIEFYEQFKAAGNSFTLIPRDRETFAATNDFIWTYKGHHKLGVEIEVKTTKAAYQSVKNHIQRAVTRAAVHGVAKKNFIVVLDRPLTAKLRNQLERYNARTSTAPIDALWVFASGELEEIHLQ